MKFNKKIRAILIILGASFILLLILLVSRIIVMDLSQLIVTSNSGISEKGYSVKIWDKKIEKREGEMLVFISIIHSKRWQYSNAGVSDMLLVFNGKNFIRGASIFNNNLFYLEGSGRLDGEKIKDVNIHSVNIGQNHKSVEYIIKYIDISESEDVDVENYFNNKVELLKAGTEIPPSY